jgi:hypothetical protein
MGPIPEAQNVGQFMHPVIDQDMANDNPWQRNYFQPPKLKKLVPRTFTLIDMRPFVSDVPTDLLKSHGFGVIKHHSAILGPPYNLKDLTKETVAEVYYPEIQTLVKKATGANHVFVIASVVRRGTSSPEAFKLPVGLKMEAGKDDRIRSGKKEIKQTEKTQVNKPVDQIHIPAGAPVRIPHMDFTPLGARQTIRSQDPNIYTAAVESGIIAAEDKICESHPFSAQTKEATSLIAEQYNQNGKLGPRYAAHSIWRPLMKIGRDPLALAPRRGSFSADTDFVYWPYENKIPGKAELGGDFLKEYAMLGVQQELPQDNSNSSNSLKWYYFSAQEPDDVLVIKLFDSAALGEDTQEADAPWHASPEIGYTGDDYPRKSIDVRVLAFW